MQEEEIRGKEIKNVSKPKEWNCWNYYYNLHFHAFFAGAGNFGVKDLVAAVKQLQRLPRPHAQYAPDMVGGIFAKRDVRMAGQWFRMINAGDTHS